MPLYAFACQRCDERFEALQSFEAAPPACPACASPAARRLLAPFAAGTGRREPSGWTPAATRRDALGAAHGHHHHHH
jgi:putative FmdB family regulatory protein